MSNDDVEPTKSMLNELSQEMVQMEQKGEAAHDYFKKHLSDQLVFRRANGTVVRIDAFMAGLKNNPFQERHSEDVSVSVQGDRALVTMIVVAKRKDDGSVHRYRNIRLFSLSGGQWIMEFWYNYEITGL